MPLDGRADAPGCECIGRQMYIHAVGCMPPTGEIRRCPQQQSSLSHIGEIASAMRECGRIPGLIRENTKMRQRAYANRQERVCPSMRAEKNAAMQITGNASILPCKHAKMQKWREGRARHEAQAQVQEPPDAGAAPLAVGPQSRRSRGSDRARGQGSIPRRRSNCTRFRAPARHELRWQGSCPDTGEGRGL